MLDLLYKMTNPNQRYLDIPSTFFIDKEIKEMYRLDSVITVADAKHIVARLDEVKPESGERGGGAGVLRG